MKKSAYLVVGLILLILFLDQWLKFWVKTHMFIGQNDIPIFGLRWARLSFVENPGMAFGMAWRVSFGKLALSLFRIVAIAFLSYFLRRLILRGAAMGLLLSLAAILAGAIGNMIDGAFYGMIFSQSYPYSHSLARLFPVEGGYETFLHGRVVDMLHFYALFPQWVPYLKGTEVFPYIFNISDSAVTCGVISILFFRYFTVQTAPTPTLPA